MGDLMARWPLTEDMTPSGRRRRRLTRAEQQVLDDYETWMLSWNASKATIKARVSFTAARFRQWGGPDGFTKERVTDYLADLVREDRKEWTISTYFTHLTAFCEYMTDSERFDVDPMMGVRVPTRPKSEPHPLSDAEVDRVLSVVTGTVRDYFLLALYVGLRAHEVAQLRGEDVQKEGIRVKGKGRKIATLPCHPLIWEMAERYPRAGYWFPSDDGEGHVPMQRVSAAVSKFFDGLGIDGGIHRGRHAYCTRLIRSGVNIREVQHLMRHTNLATTAGYAAVDENQLMAAVMRLPMPPPQPVGA